MIKKIGFVAVAAMLMMSLMVTLTYALPKADIMIENYYYLEIGPGAFWSTYSQLSDDVFGSTTGTGVADMYEMVVTGSTFIHLELVDCCMMGDTIALGKSAARYWYAMSPAIVVIEGWLDQGVYVFYVGYIPPHTGVFPAGYDIFVWG